MLRLKGVETLNKSQLQGLLVLVASLIGLALYGGLLFFSQWSILALELTCFIVAAIVAGNSCMDRVYNGYNVATHAASGSRGKP